jgi:hypothetical protein
VKSDSGAAKLNSLDHRWWSEADDTVRSGAGHALAPRARGCEGEAPTTREEEVAKGRPMVFRASTLERPIIVLKRRSVVWNLEQ